MAIKLIASDEQNKTIMDYLQMLTDHPLTLDEKGYVRILPYANKDKIKYESGNILIERIIKSDYTVKIQAENGGHFAIPESNGKKNYYNGVGDNATVNIQLSKASILPIIDSTTGFVTNMESPIYISLAHELIHADRIMRGIAIKYSKQVKYKYQTGIVTKYIFSTKFWSWEESVYVTEKKKVPKEDLATIGLKYNTPDEITENIIRLEHGLSLRGGYTWYE